MTTPGATVGNGRYRLVAAHGAWSHLRFWQAVDQATGREVAVTLVDPDGALPEEFVHEILARTVRLKGVDMPGLAPVIEVFHTGRFGVVVAEWIDGGSLEEIAATAPSAIGVASAMQSLAAAADAAHRAGLLLSIDCPARVRVGVDGHAALAFPATLPDATVAADLRGIGDVMRVLLNREAELPYLVATTLAGLHQEENGIASAATLLTLLRAATDNETGGARVMPPLPTPPPGQYADFRNFGPQERAAAARRGVMRVGLVTTAVIAALALAGLGSSLNSILDEDRNAGGLDTEKLGLNTSTVAPPPPRAVASAPAPGERVPLAAAAVFSPGGSPDSPAEAGAAIDGNPATAWSTDTYYDAEPFPKFKPGIGLLVQLERPAAISAVTVDLNSTGTVVQVRAAANNQPAALTDTGELTAPTPMQPGHNRIPVSASAPVANVVVWISTLGSADGKSRSAISEIELEAASPPA
ncbi:protein kinase family protein [Mycobacterium sp. 3519A]|uniref:protein kinase family protein n=1 Tax=Mycobacterium sp. 3519A TaxID=2057184 RepID=UPI000C7E1DF6|nr:protein kinase family protein [Mycobacterium sp. 3519A]